MQKNLPIYLIIIVGFVIIFLITVNYETIHEDAFLLFKSLKINIYNLKVTFNPPRRSPINTLSKEMQLQDELDWPFRSFSKNDWDDFWKIIYGLYPLDLNTEYPGLPGKLRHLTKGEIMGELTLRFSAFKEYSQERWGILLNKILDIKD